MCYEGGKSQILFFVKTPLLRRRIRIKRDMRQFPIVPGFGCAQSVLDLARSEPPCIGIDNALTITSARCLLKPLPCFREYSSNIFSDPINFPPTCGRYRDKNQFRNPARVRLSICELRVLFPRTRLIPTMSLCRGAS